MSYQLKDQQKFQNCNKLITRGAPNSSSDRYQDPTILGLDPLTGINTTDYTDIDVVGVSVNGMRPNRVSFDRELVKSAVLAGATIVADNTYNANRQFNIGERELRRYLAELGSIMFIDNTHMSCWKALKQLDSEASH